MEHLSVVEYTVNASQCYKKYLSKLSTCTISCDYYETFSWALNISKSQTQFGFRSYITVYRDNIDKLI